MIYAHIEVSKLKQDFNLPLDVTRYKDIFC